MADTLAGAIRDEIAKLLAPLAAAAAQPEGATLLLGAVGHADELGRDASLRAEIERLAGLAEDIAALDDEALGSLEGLSSVLDLCRDLMAAVGGMESVLADPSHAAQAQGLGVELSEVLLALYLRIHRPRLFRLAAALTLITPAERADPEPLALDGGTVTRMPWVRDRLRLDRLSALLEDPFGVLADAYLPGAMQGAADAHLAAGRLFPLLADLAVDADLGWFFDHVSVTPEPVGPPPDGDELVEPDADDEMLEAPDLGPVDLTAFHRDHLPRFGVELPGQQDGEPAASRFGLAVVSSSAEHPEAVRGFVLALFGEAGWSEVRGNWRLELAADGAIPAFVIGPDGLALAPATAVTAASAALTVERVAEAGAPAFTLGAPDSSRLEIGALRVRTDIVMSPKRQALAIAADATSAALVLAADASDGLLGTLLPGGGANVPFDLGLVLSSDRGLELRGGAGLDLALAPRLRLGPVTVEAVRLALEADGGAVRLRASGALGVRVGPVSVVVEGLGIHVTASFPEAGGSLGPLDLDAGLLPPSGAGITVDAAVIKGGGYLHFDPAKGEYAGTLELTLKVQSGTEIALKAFGLLTTRLPAGATGWSLLLLLYGEFTPIRLPYNFTLNGVGGVVGIQHGIAVDALQSGLRSGVLDDVLFPRDPVADAPRILGRLRTVFPITPRALTVGPVVRIGWGTPNVMTITLGVLLQFDDAFGGNASLTRVALLGTVLVEFPPASTRPAGTTPVLRLLVDVLGDYDVEQQALAIDARLRDSKAAELTVTGSLAVRARFGDDPSFMLAAGGFHPKYKDVPPGIPKQDRLGVHGEERDRRTPPRGLLRRHPEHRPGRRPCHAQGEEVRVQRRGQARLRRPVRVRAGLPLRHRPRVRGDRQVEGTHARRRHVRRHAGGAGPLGRRRQGQLQRAVVGPDDPDPRGVGRGAEGVDPRHRRRGTRPRGVREPGQLVGPASRGR